ncbi:S-adenosylmethionine:tRNA ribosyltransferase-isomerase [Aspergillus avenaceus]|uniref:S-adenosylmethionine:tRNA ribosyltransferase-isomerase n=1 Tax=Aspergillus avenaceus TaxID=36643 RepID=A0A5N6TNZ7_ASPAV|nr:S-adenosylmethionine:tRNA ribosyltransferase-isomerase [Aspergillus avenaceus]
MKTDDFDFKQDPASMPHDPVQLRGRTRDSGKMVVLNRSTQSIEHTIFSKIAEYFRPGDLLVLNDSYMLSNTLPFKSAADDGSTTAHITVYGHEPDGSTIVEIKADKHQQPGTVLRSMHDPRLTCTLAESQPDNLWRARFDPADIFMEVLDRHGHRQDETIPLDPIHWKTNPAAYRSVYARKPGSLEIPSAGLHFSNELLAQIAAKGVDTAFITLHVGATEILAVRHISEPEIENHKVRSEYFEVGEETAAKINAALAEGRRIIAVGTTVMRTLESLSSGGEAEAPVRAKAGWTDLYIYPGFRFRVVDVLLTNLHRPRSSHIVLTAAVAGKELVMRSYEEIVRMGRHEFDMFGDSMLIV